MTLHLIIQRISSLFQMQSSIDVPLLVPALYDLNHMVVKQTRKDNRSQDEVFMGVSREV